MEGGLRLASWMSVLRAVALLFHALRLKEKQCPAAGTLQKQLAAWLAGNHCMCNSTAWGLAEW